MSGTLFDRLGGEAGIRSIASDVVDLHCANPLIAARFKNSDVGQLKQLAGDFFITGSGGPQIYQGKEMAVAHQNMNISDNEFMTVVDDAMAALDKNGHGDAVKAEVLYIFYSLRPEVVGI
ncbi:group I truncated hemoglobin [Pontibacter sp. JAM-7]|uniref:group I truncated hemoglobin n=1 Tax=Pontibacter sp. JAM-7 TaxID=3366581 RepID=UPI003AF99494